MVGHREVASRVACGLVRLPTPAVAWIRLSMRFSPLRLALPDPGTSRGYREIALLDRGIGHDKYGDQYSQRTADRGRRLERELPGQEPQQDDDRPQSRYRSRLETQPRQRQVDRR